MGFSPYPISWPSAPMGRSPALITHGPAALNTGDVTLLLSHSQQLLNSQNQAYANLLCWRPPNLFNRLRSRERKKRIERGCFFPPIPFCFSETTLYATIPCLPHKKTTISHFPSSPPAPVLPTSIPHALSPPAAALSLLSPSVSHSTSVLASNSNSNSASLA